MMTKQKRAKIGKISAIVIIVMLLLIAGCGLIVYFTNGNDIIPFYLSIDGTSVTDIAENFNIPVDGSLNIEVKPLLDIKPDKPIEYTIKVVPNIIENKDFDFTLDDAVYPYQEEEDLTAGFNIERNGNSFTISPKGYITDILQAVYPDKTVGNCNDSAYNNMFKLIVSPPDSDKGIEIIFSVFIKVSDIELDKEVIEF